MMETVVKLRSNRFGLGGALFVVAAILAPLKLSAQVPTTTTLTIVGGATILPETFSVQVQVSPAAPVPPQVTLNPTGQVTIIAGGTILASAFLNLSGAAQFALQIRVPGSYVLQAVYSGDANYAASTSAPVPVTITLGQSIVSTILTAPVNPVAGQPVLLAVQVASLPPLTLTPRGTVTFIDGGAVILGTASLDGAGVAQIIATFLPGTHSIVAVYSGDADFAGSSSPVLLLTIQNSYTVTSLGANPTNAGLGQTVTLTASVSASGSGGIGTPTGTATFLDGTVTLGTAGLSNSTATFMISTLSLGTHVLTAVYSGDSNFAGSTSGPVVVSVRPATTVSLGLTEGANGLTLTASVSGSASSAPPTGTVQFNDVTAGTTLGTGALANGLVNLTLNTAPAGHTLQAAYLGDANNAPGVSAAAQLAVLTSGFSANVAEFAPDEFATLYGLSLAASPGTGAAPAASPIGFIDASGNTHPATILYMSAGQINIVIPSDLPPGPAILTLSGPVGTLPAVVKLSITVANVAPSLAAVGQVIRVLANGLEQSPVATATFTTTSQSWVPVPIPYGLGSTDTLYLILYGTGFRHGRGSTTCSANGNAMTVLYAGGQGSFPGLDQINVLVPASLQASGQVQLTCSLDGQTSNAMTLVFQ